ncbi:MAG TPA: Crp/Fnr family transcriptional regulator [Candidatus Saccharimonadales bacterium]|nr:Crp/Fnr family transcriptional regulator [Candidatus Saccharimonadales bacterium]
MVHYKDMTADTSQLQALHDYFATEGRTLDYAKNETILQPGDQPAGCYLITKGFVKVYGMASRGESYMHIVYAPGEMFPLPWIVDNHEARVHYAAFTDCTVIRLNGDKLQQILEHDHGLTRALMEKAVLQFRLYATRIENLQYKFARERLIYCLLFLASRFGKRRKDGSYLLEVPLTQQLIGDFINLSRESVSREFDRLRHMDLIDYEGPSLVIKDWQRMGQEFKKPIQPQWWGLQ